MRQEELTALNEVRRHLGGSRSDAVRQAVEIVAAALSDSASLEAVERTLGKRLASRRPVTIEVDPDLANEVREALDSVARRYADQTLELQKIGNDWSLLVKIASAGVAVNTDALRGIERQLTEMSATMSRQAQSDAKLANKVAAVF